MMIDLSVVLYAILGGYILAGIALLVGGILLLRLAVRWSVRRINALRTQAHRPATTKETNMRTDGGTIRAGSTVAAHPGPGAMRGWAKRAFSKERLAEAGVVVATFVVTGYVGAVLYHVTHTEWVRGF